MAAMTAINSTIASSSSAKPTVPVHCVKFPENETDKFFVGSEDFNLY